MATAQRLTTDEALEHITDTLGDKLTSARVTFDAVDVVCAPENLVEVATSLRDDEKLRLRFFTFASGVDRSAFGGDEGAPDYPYDWALEVLVHLYSPDLKFHTNIHVPVDADEPVCPSLAGVFAGANWHERETHEMFGIDFDGHPNLSHLYLPEDFEGNPLLKSFKLPGRIIKEWPGAKDPDEAAAGGR